MKLLVVESGVVAVEVAVNSVVATLGCMFNTSEVAALGMGARDGVAALGMEARDKGREGEGGMDTGGKNGRVNDGVGVMTVTSGTLSLGSNGEGRGVSLGSNREG